MATVLYVSDKCLKMMSQISLNRSEYMDVQICQGLYACFMFNNNSFIDAKIASNKS